MQSITCILLFCSIGFFSFSQQQFVSSSGKKVMFFDTPDEQAMYQLIVDPNGYNCECEEFTHFFHKISDVKFVTDDENVTLTIISGGKIKIEVQDASYCCTVKAGIYE
jgi:hypothetical protein